MRDSVFTSNSMDMTAPLQLVGFRVGSEDFGVDILTVQEIIRMVEITRIPNAPEYVEGVISLRGKVIPIVDFRKRFKMEADFDGKSQDRRIVVGAIGGITVGLVVDQVSHVIKLCGKEISPAPPAVKGFDSAFITGVGRLKDGLLIILDMEKLFSRSQIEILENAA
jgi:purine-binding chemotaxis protein CheW